MLDRLAQWWSPLPVSRPLDTRLRQITPRSRRETQLHKELHKARVRTSPAA